MAAIDKTYVKDYATWKELYDFASEAVVNGVKGELLNYCYGPYTEENFNKGGMCLWNTPFDIDLWLAENCKHPVVVNTLKFQYDDDYEEMASGEYRNKMEAEKEQYDAKRNEGCYPDGEVYFSISKNMNSHKNMSHGSFHVEITEDKTGEMWAIDEAILIPGPCASVETGYNYFSYNHWTNYFIDAFSWKKHVYHHNKNGELVHNKFYPHQFNKHFVYKLLKKLHLKPGLTVKITFDGWEYKNSCKANKYRRPDCQYFEETMILHTKNRRIRKQH